jgi:squalene-hopene/tetraprenyl-beta-curcumene cyclase
MNPGTSINKQLLAEALRNTRLTLIERATAEGPWPGGLSPSASSTAVAVVALARLDARRHAAQIQAGLDWLARHQNQDGSWGDTPCSPGNVCATLLCWAALHHVPSPLPAHAAAHQPAARWLEQRLGSLAPARLVKQVLAIHGREHPFSILILTQCALCGRLGEGTSAWAHVPQLPFELAAAPRQLFKWLSLPEAGHALGALVAIGLVRHENAGPALRPLRALRERLKPRALRVLDGLQPSRGGFSEAVPLTGFVTMALAASGLKSHPVAVAGGQFLAAAARADGSWPVAINLSTWATALSVNALAKDAPASLTAEHQQALVQWLLAQQHRAPHPPPHTRCGGGPNADDTAGALLALWHLEARSPEVQAAAQSGARWLLELQNRDGGLPAFCRGWSHLPSDHSSPDISAHTLAAWHAWIPLMPPELVPRLHRATYRALDYLRRAQRPEGAWMPAWLGNQHDAAGENPVGGTARVLLALAQLPRPLDTAAEPMTAAGLAWLARAQQKTGGWGGTPDAPPTIEETALALDALVRLGCADQPALQRGLYWLLTATKHGTRFPPSPIGRHCSVLWFAEETCPVAFTYSALAAIHAPAAHSRRSSRNSPPSTRPPISEG